MHDLPMVSNHRLDPLSLPLELEYQTEPLSWIAPVVVGFLIDLLSWTAPMVEGFLIDVLSWTAPVVEGSLTAANLAMVDWSAVLYH